VSALAVGQDGIVLDHDHCYAAVQSRDTRFDGWFVTAVRTTGIYCRPSCPAITPKRTNVDFFATAAAAQQHGFRACKRCRPDASPGSPEWNSRQDVVARTMRLIADGEVERVGVTGLARRLGYSERHLTRLVAEELGAGPLAIARAQRAHTARLLVETTSMPLTDVAYAAGFGSVRQFNDTFREVYATTPSALRQAGGDGPRQCQDGPSGVAVTVRLAARRPCAVHELLAFVGTRAVPGVEAWDGHEYRRSLDLAGGVGVVSLRGAADHVSARFELTAGSDLTAAVQRVRRLLDLDADPAAVDATLGAESALAPLVAATPGRRAPASVDPFETAVRAIIGQQVSLAAARTVAARLVGATEGRGLALFPSAEVLLGTPDELFAMPASRRATIRGLAAAVADGALDLHVGADPTTVRDQLVALSGIGPWTADYVVMRGLGHPDTFLAGDLGVRQAMDRLGLPSPDRAWAPWRSYAVHHLWASLSHPSSRPGEQP
jgi:AraC family transcriptional regulator, regulatory protein of adaptative response / DNA-3-methyladenine glycosylase II